MKTNKLAESFLGKIPVSGLLLSILPLGWIWQNHAHRLPIENVWPTALAIVALSFGLLFFIRLFSKNWQHAGIIHTIILAYILFADNVANLFSSPVLKVIVLAGLLYAVYDVIRSIPIEPALRRMINFGLTLVLIIPATALSVLIGQFYVGQSKSQNSLSNHAAEFSGTADENSPDVWHLVFDRYGGLEPLRRSYNFDNRGFLDALKSRGFNVVEPASSNYQRTTHSLASSLNATYLDEFATKTTVRGHDQTPLIRSIANNAALKFFNSQEYYTVFSGSWWDATQRSPIADENINTRALPEIGRVLLNQTVFGVLGGMTGTPYSDPRKDQCIRVQHKFEALNELASQNNRKYVFGHFLTPHPPYVIDADGSCKSLQQATEASRRDNYIGQLEYANREILGLIDSILQGPRPASIIITSDEGPWPDPYVGDERYVGRDVVNVNWTNLDEHQLKEKMGIILATRIPNAAEADHPTTPINLYPAILNSGFSGEMPVLEKRNMIFRSKARLYEFEDVTRILEAPDAEK